MLDYVEVAPGRFDFVFIPPREAAAPSGDAQPRRRGRRAAAAAAAAAAAVPDPQSELATWSTA